MVLGEQLRELAPEGAFLFLAYRFKLRQHLHYDQDGQDDPNDCQNEIQGLFEVIHTPITLLGIFLV